MPLQQSLSLIIIAIIDYTAIITREQDEGIVCYPEAI